MLDNGLLSSHKRSHKAQVGYKLPAAKLVGHAFPLELLDNLVRVAPELLTHLTVQLAGFLEDIDLGRSLPSS
jgi:hypothetical protein